MLPEFSEVNNSYANEQYATGAPAGKHHLIQRRLRTMWKTTIAAIGFAGVLGIVGIGPRAAAASQRFAPAEVVAMVETVENWTTIRSGDLDELVCTDLTVFEENRKSGLLVVAVYLGGDSSCPGDMYSELLTFRNSKLAERVASCTDCTASDDPFSQKMLRFKKRKTPSREISLLGAVQYPSASDSMGILLENRTVENGKCRGGTGNAAETEEACRRRDQLDKTITRLGWCYGEGAQFSFEMTWAECKRPKSKRT
jgi:hypothetical protein